MLFISYNTYRHVWHLRAETIQAILDGGRVHLIASAIRLCRIVKAISSSVASSQ